MRGATATLRPRVAVRPADALRGLRRAFQARPALSPRGRRHALIALLAAIALGALYLLWFRDSSFVRVEKVSISGIEGRDAPRLRAHLRYEARRMTTLHVDKGALLHSLGRNAGVRSLSIETDFPHAMRIDVAQELPVAVLVSGRDRAPVAAGGLLLPAMPATGVPAIDVGAMPMHGRLGNGRAMRLVSCAAAAPADLLPRIDRIRELPSEGLVAYLRNGPRIILGDGSLLREKWTAAAAVLADGASRGAAYVDVRMPDRPVAGGLQLGFAPQDQVTAPQITQGGSQAATGTAGPATAAAGSATSGTATGAAGARMAGASAYRLSTTGSATATGVPSRSTAGGGAAAGAAGASGHP